METEALLSALSDSQNLNKVLREEGVGAREENVQLRERLVVLEERWKWYAVGTKGA